MPGFGHIPRDYARAVEAYTPDMPEFFNFGRDVVDAHPPGRIAITAVSEDMETVRDISFGELSSLTNRFAHALAQLGLAPGAHVMVVMERVPGWFTVMLGANKAGVVTVPGTTLLTARDIAWRVQATGAEAVVVTGKHCGKVETIAAECPSLRHLITAGPARDGWRTLDDLLAAAPDTPPAVRTRATDLMMVYFTSGTTSAPKLVPRDHSYALAHAATGLFWMDLREDDLHWTLTDTGWAKAAWGKLYPPLMLGARVLLYDAPERFDAAAHLAVIERFRVTSFCAPPTVYRMLAQHDLGGYDLSSIRRSLGSGEPLNPEAIRVWQRATGHLIADGYGQTEAICLIGNCAGMEIRPGAMGRPLPGFDIDVIGDDGARLPPGEIGHIGVRVTDPWPPGLFDGYITPEGRDRRAFRNGWYYTGDTARRDADGYFWFIGRADDLILSAGYRISPFEVESALLEHPAVAESAVVAAPDPTRGQIVRAFVVLAAGHEPDAALVAELQDFCKRQTAPYKYPREIDFVTELPKTVSGKIRRVALRARG
ncbi:acyl-CoA synthetase [Oceanicella sp. SM1341]|uniref:acyl-CoA synthetase n=1 Tax=Oceanicella sp. SM1341 TaxID=1548889 RepID=UPI0018E526C1|nr:AMP-binding protein [Oceanicella sp. SM1341]